MTVGTHESPTASTYFGRHFRGEQSLAVSWWVNWIVLGQLGPAAMMRVVAEIVERENANLQQRAWWTLAILVTSTIIWSWAVVGVLRSASHHERRGGSGATAILVYVLIALGCLGVVIRLASPQTRAALVDLVGLARGDDPVPVVETSLMADGRTLLLEGSLGQGSAAHVRRELTRHREVATLRLHSVGGRIFEAREIARTVRLRALDTYVNGHCESACTIIFLAGMQRTITDTGRLGFHRASMGGNDSALVNAPMTDVYREVGLNQWFIERIAAVPSDRVWYPDSQELVDNRVVTQVLARDEMIDRQARIQGIDGLRAKMSNDPVWAAAARRFPSEIENALQSAWAELAERASERQVIDKLRTKLAALVEEALGTATDEILEKALALQQSLLTLTTDVSPERCRAFIRERLPMVSNEATRLEQLFLLELLASAPRADRRPPGRAALAALRRAIRTLPAEQVALLAQIDSFLGPPLKICEAEAAFFEALARLSPSTRALALRQVFQANEPASRPAMRQLRAQVGP